MPGLNMADTNEGVVLQTVFTSSTGTLTVILDDKQISWTTDDPSVYREGQEETIVPLLDIITVQALEDRNNEGAGFCLHYSLLGDKHMRTHAKVDFRFRDEGLATNWTETLKKRHNNAIRGRPRRLLVYINPISGGGKARGIYDKNAAPFFELAGITTDVLVTTHRGHIEEHVMEADLSNYDGIVTVGGDGTFTEVTSGLLLRQLRASGGKVDDLNMTLRATDIPVGIIPAGTGQLNVLRFYCSQDPTTAALSILQGIRYSIDTFAVHDDSRFVGLGNIMFCFGMFTHMLEAAEGNRWWLGRLRYLWGILKAVYYMNRYRCEVEVTTAKTTDMSCDGSNDIDEQSGIARFSGEVLDVLGVTYDGFTQRDYSGVLHIDVMKSHTTRREYLKYLAKYHRKLDDQNFTFIANFPGSKFRVKPNRNSENSSHVVPRYACLDGDLHAVTGEWIQVTNFARVIRVFIARRPEGVDEDHIDFTWTVN